jgi:hypothetical protein
MERGAFRSDEFLRFSETAEPVAQESLGADGRLDGAAGAQIPAIGIARGTRIKTLRGEVPVENLRPGDRVLTRDNGYQVVRWIGNHAVKSDRRAPPWLAPMRFRKGVLGRGKPEHTLRVAPGQRLLLGGESLHLHLGLSEGLVAAAHLRCIEGVAQLPRAATPYVQILFDRHELILTEGMWSESFLPSPNGIAALAPKAQAELLRHFPRLAIHATGFNVARPVLSAHDLKRVVGAVCRQGTW